MKEIERKGIRILTFALAQRWCQERSRKWCGFMDRVYAKQGFSYVRVKWCKWKKFTIGNMQSMRVQCIQNESERDEFISSRLSKHRGDWRLKWPCAFISKGWNIHWTCVYFVLEMFAFRSATECEWTKTAREGERLRSFNSWIIWLFVQ